MTGARVIATTGSDEKIERLRKLGVSDVDQLPDDARTGTSACASSPAGAGRTS